MKKFILFSWFFVMTTASGEINFGPYDTIEECLDIRRAMIDGKAGTSYEKCKKDTFSLEEEHSKLRSWSFSWDSKYE